MGFKVARIDNVFFFNYTDYLDSQIHLLAKFKVVSVYVWRGEQCYNPRWVGTCLHAEGHSLVV